MLYLKSVIDRSNERPDRFVGPTTLNHGQNISQCHTSQSDSHAVGSASEKCTKTPLHRPGNPWRVAYSAYSKSAQGRSGVIRQTPSARNLYEERNSTRALSPHLFASSTNPFFAIDGTAQKRHHERHAVKPCMLSDARTNSANPSTNTTIATGLIDRPRLLKDTSYNISMSKLESTHRAADSVPKNDIHSAGSGVDNLPRSHEIEASDFAYHELEMSIGGETDYQDAHESEHSESESEDNDREDEDDKQGHTANMLRVAYINSEDDDCIALLHNGLAGNDWLDNSLDNESSEDNAEKFHNLEPEGPNSMV